MWEESKKHSWTKFFGPRYDMKCQVGKGRATLQYLPVLAVSLHRLTECPRFSSDADLLFCPFCTKETEAQRLMLHGLGGKGFQPIFSLPTHPLHLPHCHLPLRSWFQAGWQVRGGGIFPEAPAHQFEFPNSVKAGGKVRVANPGDPPFKMAAKSFVDPTVASLVDKQSVPRQVT